MHTGRPDGLAVSGLGNRAPSSRFETFMFGAVATVLITRAYLAATGYIGLLCGAMASVAG